MNSYQLEHIVGITILAVCAAFVAGALIVAAIEAILDAADARNDNAGHDALDDCDHAGCVIVHPEGER